MQLNKVVKFRARAKILLNGRAYGLLGQGLVDDENGVVDGQYKHDVPANDADPLIFQTVLVTGYPSVCRSPMDQPNPFKQGNYTYSRQIDFGEHGAIAYEANCWLVEEDGQHCLESDFDVRGNLVVPKLRGAGRVTEVWTQDSLGIASSFEISWPTAEGRGEVIGRASTLYHPHPLAMRLSRPSRREIVFHRARADAGNLEIIQESWLAAEDET